MTLKHALQSPTITSNSEASQNSMYTYSIRLIATTLDHEITKLTPEHVKTPCTRTHTYIYTMYTYIHIQCESMGHAGYWAIDTIKEAIVYTLMSLAQLKWCQFDRRSLCVCVCVHVCMCVCVCVECAYGHTRIHICTCTYVHTYVHMYLHASVQGATD